MRSHVLIISNSYYHYIIWDGFVIASLNEKSRIINPTRIIKIDVNFFDNELPISVPAIVSNITSSTIAGTNNNSIIMLKVNVLTINSTKAANRRLISIVLLK